MNITNHLVFAGFDPFSIILGIIYLGSAAVAYTGYKKAKKLSQQTVDRARGTLAQIRATAVPRRLVFGTVAVGGIDAYFAGSGDNNEYLHFIEIWCDGPIRSVKHLLLDNEKVEMVDTGGGIFVPADGSKYAGLIRWESEIGTEVQPPHGQGIIPGWESTDILAGIAYSWIELKYDPDVFATGQPSLSAIVEGLNNIRDPRTDTEDYTTNPALCWAYYMSLVKRGPGIDFDNEIRQPELITAANDCEDLITLSADTGTDSNVEGGDLEGGVAYRYTFNGVVTLDKDPEEIIELFRTAMAGTMVYVNGKWSIYAGVYQTPTFVITEDMLVGPIKKRNKISRKDRINTITGVYVSEKTNWEPTNFPTYAPAEYLEQDKGQVLPEDIDLSMVNSIPRCRRLCKIFLMRTRFERSLTLSLNVNGYRAQAAKTVLVHLPNHGYNMMPADVRSVDFSIKDRKIFVDIGLNETSPTIYEWDATGESGGSNLDSDFAGEDTNSTNFQALPNPPDPDTNASGLYYIDLLNNSKVSRTVYCRTVTATATLYGLGEFTDVSNPPKKYLTATFAGTRGGDVFTDPLAVEGDLCSGPYNGKFTSAFSGSATYDDNTGANLTTGSHQVIEYDQTDTETTNNTYDLDGTGFTGSAVEVDCGGTITRTKTLWTKTPNGICCQTSDIPFLAVVSNGSPQTVTLSNEMTEEMAKDIAFSSEPELEEVPYSVCNSGDNTLPCCFSHWGIRDLGPFQFVVTKAQFKIELTNFAAEGFCRLLLQIYEVDLATGVVSKADLVEYETYASILGVVEFEYTLPLEQGKKFFVGTLKYETL